MEETKSQANQVEELFFIHQEFNATFNQDDDDGIEFISQEEYQKSISLTLVAYKKEQKEEKAKASQDSLLELPDLWWTLDLGEPYAEAIRAQRKKILNSNQEAVDRWRREGYEFGHGLPSPSTIEREKKPIKEFEKPLTAEDYYKKAWEGVPPPPSLSKEEERQKEDDSLNSRRSKEYIKPPHGKYIETKTPEWLYYDEADRDYKNSTTRGKRRRNRRKSFGEGESGDRRRKSSKYINIKSFYNNNYSSSSRGGRFNNNPQEEQKRRMERNKNKSSYKGHYLNHRKVKEEACVPKEQMEQHQQQAQPQHKKDLREMISIDQSIHQKRKCSILSVSRLVKRKMLNDRTSIVIIDDLDEDSDEFMGEEFTFSHRIDTTTIASEQDQTPFSESSSNNSDYYFASDRSCSINKDDIVALDCEMVLDCNQTNRLARCSIVNYYGKVLFDKFILPVQRIKHYQTKYSGVGPWNLKDASSYSHYKGEIENLLKNKYIIGHSLHNDFKVLGIFPPHEKVKDLTYYEKCCYKGKGHQPKALKKLAEDILRISIQEGPHNSVEDARATLKLYKSILEGRELN